LTGALSLAGEAVAAAAKGAGVTGAVLCSMARSLGARVEAEGAATTHLVDGGEPAAAAAAAAAGERVSPWWLVKCFTRLAVVDVRKFRLAKPQKPPPPPQKPLPPPPLPPVPQWRAAANTL
jgi:hypothetical protein